MASKDGSKAIIVTFWGSLFALFIVYGLLGWKGNVTPILNNFFPNNDKTDNVVLAFVMIMVIRHQCRVAFYDSTYFTTMERSSERLVMGLLFPAAILGGILVLIFSFGIKVGGAAMAVYSGVFLFVGFFTANAHTGEHSGRSQNMAISWVIDFLNMLLWFWVAIVNEVNQNRAWLFILVVSLCLVVEFKRVFREGVVERFNQALKIVFG